jgi:hypothetical protein
MVKVALLWAVASVLGGCATLPTAAPSAPSEGPVAAENPLDAPPQAAPSPRARPLRTAAESIAGEVPERDPAARGRLAIDMSAADLPDDRDGDGVDQLDLCPELPPDRVDGCPHAR